MRRDLLGQKERGDHLSSLIPNRPMGLLTNIACRRRVTMPCFAQLESSRLTVNIVVAVICANSSCERLISRAPSTLRPTCGSNRISSRARRGATLSVEISRKRPSSTCRRCARIHFVLRCRSGNRSNRASKVDAFQTSALHERSASAVEPCLPRCADPTDPTISPGPSSRMMTALPFSPNCVIFTDPSVSNTISLIASPAKKIVCRRANFVGRAADTMFAQSARGMPTNSGDSSE